MQDKIEPDDLDVLLRHAMQARLPPRAADDLVERAMALATAASPAPMAILSRVRWWNRMATAVAAVIIVAISVWVFRAHLSAGGFQSWSDTAVSSSDSSTDASITSTDSSSSTQWMFVGIGLAVTAVGILATQRTIGSGDLEFILSAGVLAGVEGSCPKRR